MIDGNPKDFLQMLGRSTLNFNSTRMLNGQMLSSIPEPSKLMARYGMSKFISAAAKNMKNIKLSTIPRDEAARIASATYRAQQIVSANLTELYDVTPTSVFERGTRVLSNTTYTLSGQQHFDAFFKAVAGLLSSDKFSSLAKAGDIASLRKAGFDNIDIKIIEREFSRHSTFEDGLYNPHVELWDTTTLDFGFNRPAREFADKYKAMLIKDADTTIVMPGAGDKPFFMDKMSGRLLLQFKSFILGATNRTMIPIAQRGSDFWKHTTLMSGTGLMSYYLYAYASGKEVSTDPAVLAIEAMNRGGYLGYATDLALTTAKVSGVGPQASRYQSRSGSGAVLGPTVGTLDDMIRAFNFGSDKKTGDYYVDADARVHAFRKLLPFQNHFVARRMLDIAEGKIAESFGGTGRFGDADAGKSTFKY
jgi:hypothetical protein